ncbi:D-2-hydroxyacid dehydrogenase family protein [Mesorhizobium sp. B3-1-6]|uniref:D-2-hydroxyacid dehydrogenase family protein n=1 Tax=Mesorhizobium sp. B3-1-6 TaxID=2589895 RepID=UPI00112C0955|nr:D-2-hydroxyacid dehydrogenase family protein [Mesorhizobium sp. B3-1-6]TPI41352.1 D-2-hydroxyacid dehydrogenase family protein [Mesorhizobium sp. B3-1-6]
MPSSPAISIAVLDDYQRIASSMANWHGLSTRAKVSFFHDHAGDADDLIARLLSFDVVVLMRERSRIDATVIESLPRLKLVVTVGTWNAAIDMEAARKRGVVVCGTEGGGSHGPSALTWALIMAITRNVAAEAASVRAGGWQTSLGYELAGKTLGLLGLGTLGMAVARYGQAFGMRAIAWSQNLTQEIAAEAGVERVEKNELFRNADVLSVHYKLSERSRDLVGEDEIALMKPTAYLINTSRGPIVSEKALIAALQERRIAGAALDVFDQEPLPPEHPFRFLPNVLATPHIGYVTEETYRRAYGQIVENIHAWLQGSPLRVLNE